MSIHNFDTWPAMIYLIEMRKDEFAPVATVTLITSGLVDGMGGQPKIADAKFEAITEELSPTEDFEDVSRTMTMLRKSFIKQRLGVIQMRSDVFQVNEARLMLSMLTYNLTYWLRMLRFPPKHKEI